MNLLYEFSYISDHNFSDRFRKIMMRRAFIIMNIDDYYP